MTDDQGRSRRAGGAARPRQRSPRGQGGRVRDELVRAADALLEERGSVDAVTVAEIVGRVGVTAPVLYSHFADKHALMAAVHARQTADFRTTLRRAAARGRDSIDALERRGRAYLRYALDRPEAYRTLFMTPASLAEKVTANRADSARSDVHAARASGSAGSARAHAAASAHASGRPDASANPGASADPGGSADPGAGPGRSARPGASANPGGSADPGAGPGRSARPGASAVPGSTPGSGNGRSSGAPGEATLSAVSALSAFDDLVANVQACVDEGLIPASTDVILAAHVVWTQIHGLAAMLIAMPDVDAAVGRRRLIDAAINAISNCLRAGVD